MPIDFLGNVVTGTDATAVAVIDDFVGGLIAYDVRAVNLLKQVDAMPDVPLVQTYAGFLHLLAETQDAVSAARPFVAAAKRTADHATPRERQLIAALEAWVAGDIDATTGILDDVLRDHPRDLATLKLLHYHQFNRGDFPAMLRVAIRSAGVDPALPYVLGMLAFAYEQLHLLRDAEDAARRALAIVPDDPWAQHALAHVTLTEGRIDEGVALLEGWAGGWVTLNSFMLTHLWWHLALFYLSQGREVDAFRAYDDHVWAAAKDYSQDQIGAVSLLARLELAGSDVGARWTDLAGYLAARAEDVVQPFLSVQYLYGLARAERPEADRLMVAIEAVAVNGPAHSRAVWHDVAVPLARGLLAHARGRHEDAASALTAALPHIVRLGGSHAQRDLFEQILLDATIRSGELILAQQMLELRRAHDPDGVALNRLLATVYRALDLPAQADAAQARVTRRLAA
ncbi:MAG: tetratricopeptide repeat protein [Pseudomonadota bacterium]